MNSLKTYAVLGAALAIGAGTAAIEASGSTASSSSTTLTLTAVERGGKQLDFGKKGPSVGDEFLGHGVITAGAHGTFDVIGQFASGNTKHGTEHSILSLVLRGGTIEAVGSHGLVESYTLAVVGGTGAYTGARGTVDLSSGKGETEKVVVRLD